LILTDTGPLIALLDRDDRHHRAAHEVAFDLPPGPLLTTMPCFTEAMHILRARGGHRYQTALWAMYLDGRVALHDLSAAELTRMAALMDKYNDTPMDLADASLVSAAEASTSRRVFTFDRHFLFYRLADGSVLESIPGR
jgi:predicted nucleic acid-binding protein